jgi:hypothetical protein
MQGRRNHYPVPTKSFFPPAITAGNRGLLSTWPDQTTGFDHVGLHRQPDLPPRVPELSGGRAEAASTLGLREPDRLAPPTFPRHARKSIRFKRQAVIAFESGPSAARPITNTSSPLPMKQRNVSPSLKRLREQPASCSMLACHRLSLSFTNTRYAGFFVRAFFRSGEGAGCAPRVSFQSCRERGKPRILKPTRNDLRNPGWHDWCVRTREAVRRAGSPAPSF